MELPILLQRHGRKILLPFKWTGKFLRWVWKKCLRFDGDFGWIGITLAIALPIFLMFSTGAIRIDFGANEEQVRTLYQEVLKRDVDEDGLKHYANSGKSVEDVKADLLASEEKKQLDVKIKEAK